MFMLEAGRRSGPGIGLGDADLDVTILTDPLRPEPLLGMRHQPRFETGGIGAHVPRNAKIPRRMALRETTIPARLDAVVAGRRLDLSLGPLQAEAGVQGGGPLREQQQRIVVTQELD